MRVRFGIASPRLMTTAAPIKPNTTPTHLQPSPWQTTPGDASESRLSPSGNDPAALNSEWVALKAAELDTLKRELGALKDFVGQQQKRRVAELHRGREKRIEAIMAELLPLPDTLQVPVAPTDGQLEAAPRAPSPRAITTRPSTAPVATPSQRPRAAAPPMVTPSTSRTTISYAASNASLASSKRAPPSKVKPGPPKPGPPKPLAPAAAALAAQMHESKYTRPARILASTSAAAAAAKQRIK